MKNRRTNITESEEGVTFYSNGVLLDEDYLKEAY